MDDLEHDLEFVNSCFVLYEDACKRHMYETAELYKRTLIKAEHALCEKHKRLRKTGAIEINFRDPPAGL
jgi:hypothetical protein